MKATMKAILAGMALAAALGVMPLSAGRRDPDGQVPRTLSAYAPWSAVTGSSLAAW